MFENYISAHGITGFLCIQITFSTLICVFAGFLSESKSQLSVITQGDFTLLKATKKKYR